MFLEYKIRRASECVDMFYLISDWQQFTKCKQSEYTSFSKFKFYFKFHKISTSRIITMAAGLEKIE